MQHELMDNRGVPNCILALDFGLLSAQKKRFRFYFTVCMNAIFSVNIISRVRKFCHNIAFCFYSLATPSSAHIKPLKLRFEMLF